MGKIKYWYCDYCEKEVEPSKKSLDSFQKTVWAMASVCSLGVGVIVFLIYNKYGRKKKYCPDCEIKISKISDEPFEKPKPLEHLTAKEKVLVKSGKKITEKKVEKVEEVEVKEEEEVKKVFCPFCGEELAGKDATRKSCPFCKADLSDRI
ncbi:MAG: hypothetical protein EU529_16380 [Promethearchaeota archaeon]|nr:MAG: hypothetical protein EU529_16380 [Candidatus Lokiarchaeota archaeon]